MHGAGEHDDLQADMTDFLFGAAIGFFLAIGVTGLIMAFVEWWTP